MIIMDPKDFFERFGTPDTWKPVGAGIACGPGGCVPFSKLPEESRQELASYGRYLKAKRDGDFTGSFDDWRDIMGGPEDG